MKLYIDGNPDENSQNDVPTIRAVRNATKQTDEYMRATRNSRHGVSKNKKKKKKETNKNHQIEKRFKCSDIRYNKNIKHLIHSEKYVNARTFECHEMLIWGVGMFYGFYLLGWNFLLP